MRTLVPLLAFALAGCTSAYYGAMEQVGVHKRDILRDRVEAGREDQREAQEQFASTYEEFKALTGYDGGDLETVYRKLDADYEECRDRAADVHDRIESIETVGEDLFDEWEAEIDQISNAGLRRDSEAKLRRTRTQLAELVAAMRRSEAKMEPVLGAFRDQTLYLKHNLNARAIASLEGTVGEIEDEVAALIAQMEESIRESERFLASL